MSGFGIPVYAGNTDKRLTYAECHARWQNRRGPQLTLERIKLGHSTYLQCAGGDPPVYYVLLHDTDILRYHPGGEINIRTGGWMTVTTKSRLNEFGPVAIWSHKGVWTVARLTEGGWETHGMFRENMIVGPRGGLRRPTKLEPAAKGYAVSRRCAALRKAYLKHIPQIADGITRHVFQQARHFRPMPIWKAICEGDHTPEFLAAMIVLKMGQYDQPVSWNEFARRKPFMSTAGMAKRAFSWFTKYHLPAWIEKVVREDIQLPRREVNTNPRRLAYTKLFEIVDDEMI